LPPGEDPDTFIRKRGPQGYAERLEHSMPYLQYLLDRLAAGQNLRSVEGKTAFVDAAISVVDGIPERTRQELFVKEVAGRAAVSEDVIWARAKKAVTHFQPRLDHSQMPGLGQVTKAEKGLIWLLVHQPEDSLEALASLDGVDFEGLAGGRILDLAQKLNEDKGFSPAALLERLTDTDVQLVTAIASEGEAHVRDAHDCVRILKRLRWERERAAIQREIDRLQEVGALEGEKLQELLVRKYDVIQRLEALI